MYSKKSYFSLDYILEREGGDLDLHLMGDYASDPGRCSGPPENCYPPEESLNYKLTLNGLPWEGDLSLSEQDDLESYIRENIEEDDSEDPREYEEEDLEYE